MKSVWENEASQFCFALTLWSLGMVKVSESGIKYLEVNDAYKHGRYEQMRLHSLCVMSNVRVFAMQDGWPAS